MTPGEARIEQISWTAELQIRYALSGAPDLQLAYGKRVFVPDVLVVICGRSDASESWSLRKAKVSGQQRLVSGSTGTARYDNEYWSGKYRALPDWLIPLVDAAIVTANARHLFVGEVLA